MASNLDLTMVRLEDIEAPLKRLKAKRDDFADAMAMLISTPGARSDNPMFFGGRRSGKAAVAAAMTQKGAWSASATYNVGDLVTMPNGQVRVMTNTGLKTVMPAPPPAIRGKEITGIWLDEFGDFDMATSAATLSQEAIDRLNELAGRMTEYFTKHKPTVSLLSPGTLTVTVPSKGFQKVNHIGGEDFTVSRAYVGSQKAGSRLIFVFKPSSASTYTEMEMNENDAQTQLDGFRAAANLAAGGDFIAELKEVRRIDSAAREADAVKEKFNDYAEFGAW